MLPCDEVGYSDVLRVKVQRGHEGMKSIVLMDKK